EYGLRGKVACYMAVASEVRVNSPQALRHISRDRVTLLVCMTTFLSYLPEAGEYSCFFVYLRLVMNFTEENVALFIAICGLFSCVAQSVSLQGL
ncbi:hypothetical protein ACTXT7_017311, partial [Hymenolepis weldensis]